MNSLSIGDKIGKLVILELFYGKPRPRKNRPNKVYRTRYGKCLCSLCNNNCIKDCGTLYEAKRKNSKVINCGCAKTKGKHSWGDGRKQPNKNKHGKYFCYQYLTYLKKQAKKKNFLDFFDITLEYLDSLYEKQNGLCYFSGRKLILPSKNKSFTKNKHLWNVSVDRIDSNLPYTKDNIVLCTSIVNICKNSLSNDQFIRLCKDISNNN